MYKIFLLFFFAAVSVQCKPKTAPADTPSEAPEAKSALKGIPNYWEITESHAEEMQKYFECNSDTCFKSIKLNFDQDSIDLVVKALMQNESHVVDELSMLSARYMQGDQKNYGRRVGGYPTELGNDSTNKADVVGYSTKILRFRTHKVDRPLQKRVYYMDLATICPPPRGCSKSAKP